MTLRFSLAFLVVLALTTSCVTNAVRMQQQQQQRGGDRSMNNSTAQQNLTNNSANYQQYIQDGMLSNQTSQNLSKNHANMSTEQSLNDTQNNQQNFSNNTNSPRQRNTQQNIRLETIATFVQPLLRVARTLPDSQPKTRHLAAETMIAKLTDITTTTIIPLLLRCHKTTRTFTLETALRSQMSATE